MKISSGVQNNNCPRNKVEGKKLHSKFMALLPPIGQLQMMILVFVFCFFLGLHSKSIGEGLRVF